MGDLNEVGFVVDENNLTPNPFPSGKGDQIFGRI
jgi:hypothetical protein